MTRYRVPVSRSLSESTSVVVEASDPVCAEMKAWEKVNAHPESFTWKRNENSEEEHYLPDDGGAIRLGPGGTAVTQRTYIVVYWSEINGASAHRSTSDQIRRDAGGLFGYGGHWTMGKCLDGCAETPGYPDKEIYTRRRAREIIRKHSGEPGRSGQIARALLALKP